MLPSKQPLRAVEEESTLFTGWSINCVSDAHTHIERLVFAGLKLDDGSYTRLCLQIGGKRTRMIEGGDEKEVHPDEIYLQKLASLSGYEFGGIE